MARRLFRRDCVSTYWSVTSSLVTARATTSRAVASIMSNASSSDAAGTRMATAPVWRETRSELTSHPPSEDAMPAMRSTVSATSSTMSDMRAVWTMTRFCASGERRRLPEPPSLPGGPATPASSAFSMGGGDGVGAGAASVIAVVEESLLASTSSHAPFESGSPPQAAASASNAVTSAASSIVWMVVSLFIPPLRAAYQSTRPTFPGAHTFRCSWSSMR